MAEDHKEGLNDIVSRILQAVMDASGDTFTDEMARQVENQIRNEYGGEKFYVEKKTHIPLDTKDRAVKEYLAGEPVEKVTSRNGISRATLYRHLKR